MARRIIAALAILILVLAASAEAHTQRSSARFQGLVEAYFSDYFERHPSAATAAGFHQYDTRLEDYSARARGAEVASLQSFYLKFAALDGRLPSGADTADLKLVLSNIRASLLELETIRMWQKNPDRYSSDLSQSVFSLMARKFAPAADRLKSVVAREKRMPAVFTQARANLSHPPRVYTEIALEQLPGIVSFFENDVPSAFKEVSDAALLTEFHDSNQGVIEALRQYQKFLQDDLLARSDGDFRLGAENYRKKLLYDEMVDIPLDRLLRIGYADLQSNQRKFQQVAAQLDHSRTPGEILLSLGTDHPQPTKLLQSFRDVLGSLQQFIVGHRIVTIPSPVPPIVEETPPFARALSSASMDTPGPYEMRAKEAFFNVTLPESTWAPAKVEEFMTGFSHGTLISTAIHEAYPGHYVQFLWVQHAPSKVRKLLGCSSNAEGWAHYCEQMMLDEGYGGGDLKLRLGQLQDALLRNARYIVGIKMHSGQMSFDEAVDFFVKEGYQSHEIGLRETRRGTADPTYLYYTLGKLEILKLREDYHKMRGPRFTLHEFHDRFMQQGYAPLKLVRQALLGTDSPVL